MRWVLVATFIIAFSLSKFAEASDGDCQDLQGEREIDQMLKSDDPQRIPELAKLYDRCDLSSYFGTVVEQKSYSNDAAFRSRSYEALEAIAELGNYRAAYVLALAYGSGRGLEPDIVIAYYWSAYSIYCRAHGPFLEDDFPDEDYDDLYVMLRSRVAQPLNSQVSARASSHAFRNCSPSR